MSFLGIFKRLYYNLAPLIFKSLLLFSEKLDLFLFLTCDGLKFPWRFASAKMQIQYNALRKAYNSNEIHVILKQLLPNCLITLRSLAAHSSCFSW